MARSINLETVQEILIGKLPSNKNRFKEANGIVFSVNNMSDDTREYFSSRGIEFHNLVSGIYYTETIMSVAEFSQLDYVMHYKKIA